MTETSIAIIIRTEELDDIMQSLALIHLSDLHLRAKTQFDTNSTLGTMVKDIRKIISDQHLERPFIAISGDLTFGGKPEEFDLVREFVEVVKDQIQPTGIIFCSGNHDMDWEEHSKTCMNSELMENLIRNPGAEAIQRIERRFGKELDLSHLKCGMTNYYDFLRKIGQSYDEEYLYSLLSIRLEKFRINFVSLNSAYLFSNEFSSFGYIGKSQIEKAYLKVQENLADDCKPFNIALFHHSFESIAPASLVETENLVKSRFNIILTGHVHNLKVYQDLTANLVGENRRRPIISCTRCVFDEIGDPFITPGYSIVKMDFDVDTVSSIGIYESKYNRNTRQWIRDPDLEYPITIGDFSHAPKPRLLKSQREMYEAGIRIATSHAHKNLIVYQRTPSLLLGAKPYDESTKYDYEERFISCLESKIESCVRNKNTSILYLFSANETKEVLEKFPQTREKAKTYIPKLKRQEEESDHRFRFEDLAFHVSGPLVIGDSGYMVWIGSRSIGKNTEIVVLASDHSADTGEMIRDLEGKFAIKQSTAEQLISAVGLRK